MSIELFGDQPWAPTHYTPPLRPGPILSDGPRLVRTVQAHYRDPAGDELTVTGPVLDPAGTAATQAVRSIRLDRWQCSLLTHVLERYPLDWPVEQLRGRLRFRQVLISFARQNGKSLIGAVLGLYGLIQHVRGPNVLGVATSREKANVVYRRVRYAVDHDPDLHAILKATGTRGISRRDGAGMYQVQPTLADGVQGEPASLAVADELHITPEIMWDSLVKGQTSKAEALVIGISTEGDESSRLMIRLVDRGHAAIADPRKDERFGMFLWQGPEHPDLSNDDHIKAANPAAAEGRISVELIRADARDQPASDLERYTFNRRVKIAGGTWLDMATWRDRATTEPFPDLTPDVQVSFGVGKTEKWQGATITAAVSIDGITRTDVIASIVNPSPSELYALLEDLGRRHPGAEFAMNSSMSQTGKDLRDRGFEVRMLTPNEQCQAAEHIYALIARGDLTHPGDELLTKQLPRSRRRNGYGGWSIHPDPTAGDAVTATVAGVWSVQARPPHHDQMF